MPTKIKQIGSILLTFFLYQFLLGWKVSLLLVGGVLFHELCHIFVAQKLNLKTNGLVMIPFLGGISFIADRYKTYWQQALVALGGPIGGGLSAFIVYIAYLLTGVQFLGISAYFLCLFNLFNLVPLSGILDGGQVMSTINYSINKTVGFYYKIISTIIAVIILFHLNPLFAVFIGFFGAKSIWTEYYDRKYISLGMTWMVSSDYLDHPKRMSINQIVMIILLWLLIVGILLFLFVQCHNHGLTMQDLFKR